MKYTRKNIDFNPNHCGVTHFLKRIGGQWKVLVIYGISTKVNRFSLLQKAIPKISKQSLVNVLRELEEDNIVERSVLPDTPVKVEYALTEYGKTLLPVIHAAEEWGQTDMKGLNKGQKLPAS